MLDYIRNHICWSVQTFGTGRRTLGILAHIKTELLEIQQKPDDLSEWIDIIILAIDGYWRHGGTAESLYLDLQRKQQKNMAREWPKPVSEDLPVEHIR